MKIRLRGRASGPNGCWAVGDIMTVGVDLTQESAEHLIATGQADLVSGPVLVETAEAAPAPETAASTGRRKPRRPRNPKGA